VLRRGRPMIFRKSRKGRLWQIGSLTAVSPHPNLWVYITFRAVLAMLVRTVALENNGRWLDWQMFVLGRGTMDTRKTVRSIPPT